MAKSVVVFEAADGTRFATEQECLDYEHRAQLLDLHLGLMEDAPNVIPQDRYFQHDRENVEKAWCGVLFETFAELGGKALLPVAKIVEPSGYVGRVVDECGSPALKRAWHRFARINFETFREYGQPYYVAHAEEAPTPCTPASPGT